MPNQTFRRWTADDIAQLINLAQKQPRQIIAAELGRSASATSAHQLGLSLRVTASNTNIPTRRLAAPELIDSRDDPRGD
jgi:uncharacterized iron-regulated protein